MDIQEIKQRLARPAVKLIAGGFRPTGTDEESWLGKVFLFRPDEGLPANQAGQPLLPYEDKGTDLFSRFAILIFLPLFFTQWQQVSYYPQTRCLSTNLATSSACVKPRL
ncbi:hypothetical protein [Pseudomonas corrugata]|uniref:hypothetical protein n=1 Tax=Pseudomonas corrugata TaxID=47879 RepID=UPI00223468D1|nr:hypothetical protein [Pseudomonas corrugata]UZE09086.1 hypothetical protein LOY65_00370 [Pseudomonas corrugata]